MVLELQVGLALAVLGLLGLALLPFERSLRALPSQWVGFFVGVLLFLVLHDFTDALQAEPVVRLEYGLVSALSLAAIALLLGGGSASLFLRPRPEEGNPWTSVLLFLGVVLALHAAVDGLFIGENLEVLSAAQVQDPRAVSLQAAHRFLEGGVLVAVFLLAQVRKTRIAAAVLYVGLPFLATGAAPALDFALLSALRYFLGLMEAGAFFVLLVLGLWPVLSRQWRDVQAAQWMLVGLFAAFVAHGLAHA